MISGVATPLTDYYLGHTITRKVLDNEIKKREQVEQKLQTAAAPLAHPCWRWLNPAPARSSDSRPLVRGSAGTT